MLAHERRAEYLDCAHLLAGMYIECKERLYKFWSDPEGLEEIAVSECGLDDPRWSYWIRAYEGYHSHGRRSFVGKFKMRSLQVERVYAEALKIAQFRDEHDQGSVPVLTPEDLLLAMARSPDLELGKVLFASGLEMKRLEDEVGRKLGSKKRMMIR
ncbi:MAG: hypothetical protein HY234_00370 [Acidobacteria bacterium]|nr:hypothetical protein [Acidobacteriota bacterium]MBI3661495.1 hypothetical protein [Acidobacteriota bacterium]